MKKHVQIKALMALMVFGMMFSSCGNIDIVKRRYRPGFHVDISKKRQKTKVAQQSAVADSRKTEMAKQIETKRVETVIVKEDETLTAEAGKATPSNKLIHQKSGKSKTERTKSGFTGLDFKRWVRNAKNGIRADRSPRVSSSWMSWVSFGTGIGSMAFGLMAILFAILLASSYFIWPALILAGAAITFAVLYKSQNGTDPKAKLGMLFGIIGGGLAFIALIVWAIWLATAFRGVL